MDRIEHSIRNISIALASIYFHFDTKTDWDDCTAKDGKNSAICKYLSVLDL